MDGRNFRFCKIGDVPRGDMVEVYAPFLAGVNGQGDYPRDLAD